MTSARELDIMLLGEDTAVQLGVNVEFVKKKVLIVSSIVTAAVVPPQASSALWVFWFPT